MFWFKNKKIYFTHSDLEASSCIVRTDFILCRGGCGVVGPAGRGGG